MVARVGIVALVVPAVSAINELEMGMHRPKDLGGLAVSVAACSWAAGVGIVDPSAGSLVAAAIPGADLVEEHSMVSQERMVALVGSRRSLAEDMAREVEDENWNEVSSVVGRGVHAKDDCWIVSSVLAPRSCLY